MTLQKIALSATALAASALALTATPAFANGTTPPTMATAVAVGTAEPAPNTSGGYFTLSDVEPDYSSVTGNFGASVNAAYDSASGSKDYFDYSFNFTIPNTGTGSGSLSTSFSGITNDLVITDVTIDNVDYTADMTATTTPSGKPDGQDLVVGDIPISAYALNSIVVQGYLAQGGKAGSFDGTATFIASPSAAPEPAAWALMIGGLGMVGTMMRRRNSALRFA